MIFAPLVADLVDSIKPTIPSDDVSMKSIRFTLHCGAFSFLGALFLPSHIMRQDKLFRKKILLCGISCYILCQYTYLCPNSCPNRETYSLKWWKYLSFVPCIEFFFNAFFVNCHPMIHEFYCLKSWLSFSFSENNFILL